MRLKKLMFIPVVMSMCVSSVHAQDYTTNPKELLEQMSTMYSQDDEDFYQIAKENLSSEAYNDISQTVASNLGDALGGTTPAISSTDDIVKLARKEMKWYKKYKKDNPSEKNGKYYVSDYGMPTSSGSGSTICIDAGHQAKANTGQEPVGKGSSEKKTKVTDGTVGKYTHKKESVVNLAVAKKLKSELTHRGYKVVMTRESQNVDISNIQRAKIANHARADLFIRIHCDGDSSGKGFFVIVPSSSNKYLSSDVVSKSKKLADAMIPKIKDASGEETSTISRYAGGISYRDDLTGTNWATMPSALVEMGEMTNKEDDEKLASADFQQKMAKGMADGIDSYFGKTSEGSRIEASDGLPWSGMWLAYMCYNKFQVFGKDVAYDSKLSISKSWISFFKKHADIGTYNTYSKKTKFEKGDIIIWENRVGIYTKDGKYISGDEDDTIKEKKVSSEKKKILGFATLSLGGGALFVDDAEGGTSVKIPQSYKQTYTCTELHGHLTETSYHWFTTNKSTAAKIARLWKKNGEHKNNYIATIDNAYLCATTHFVGGEDGNILAVKFSNGKTIKCIKIDEKNSRDSNCTKFGHMTDGSLSVVEFYLGTGNPNRPSPPLSIHWKCQFDDLKVVSVTKVGKLKGYEKL